MHQLTLPFRHHEGFLKSYLERGTGKTVSLVITDNATSVLSLKGDGASVAMRLHKMFLSAGREVLDELVAFIRDTNRKTPQIQNFIDRNTPLLRRQTNRTVRIQTEGRYYNLLRVFNSVNREYFENRVSVPITWGQRRKSRRTGERTLGSYCSHSHIIRINPILDRKNVPRYFLEYIVYHEMLHAFLGIEEKGGRRLFHTGEFKKRERLFRHYHRALAWEKKTW